MDGKPGVFLDLPEVNLAEEAVWKGQRELADESGGVGFKCAFVINLLLNRAQVLLSCQSQNGGVGRRWQGGEEKADAFWLSSRSPRSLGCRPGPNLSPCGPGGDGVTCLGLR